MRGYLFIDDQTKDLYLNTMFDAYWKDNLDTSKEVVLKKLLEKCLIISRQGDSIEYKRVFMNIVNKGKNQENYLIL